MSDHPALVAASVALPVSTAAAVVTIASGESGLIIGALHITIPGMVAAIATAIATHLLLIRRHRNRDRAANRRLSATRRELGDEKIERAILRELDAAIDLAGDERGALEVIRESFGKHLSMQPMELHLVHPTEPVLELVLATGDHATRPGARTSPWDSVAARTNTTLVYATTDGVGVCPHLRSRLHAPMSAIAVPVNAMGQLLGVLYGLGPEGQQPGAGDVKFIEDIAHVIGARLAVIRSFTRSSRRADEVDRLTSLPDRAAMQERVLQLLHDRQPFTVAVADIDHFTRFNETHGSDAGDRALQLLARVARDAVRPGDVIGRIGGDEFLFVLPSTNPDDATRAFERLRESLVLAQTEPGQPHFSLSIGVIGSDSGGTIEEILQRAAGALAHARSHGGNRVILAHAVREAPPA